MHEQNSDSGDFLIRKRIINHRNKQIETRIQRKIVLENGVMVSDSGPQVTTKTIEDTRQEYEEIGPFKSTTTTAQHNCTENNSPSSTSSSYNYPENINNLDTINRTTLNNHNHVENDRHRKNFKTKTKAPETSYLFGFNDYNPSIHSSIGNNTNDNNDRKLRGVMGKLPKYYFGQYDNKSLRNANKRNNQKNHKMVINDDDDDDTNIIKKDKDKNENVQNKNYERDCQYVYEYGNFSRYLSSTKDNNNNNNNGDRQ